MRKILITGVAAVLALGLTACNGEVDGGSAAAPPSAPAPSGTATPGEISTPDAPSAPSGTSTPQNPGGSDTSSEQQGQQITEKWGTLSYLAPGKFLVGDVAFFTATDTAFYVAGGTCPDGTVPADESKCSLDGFDEWVQNAPHNAVVEFSGQSATLIRETQ
ncbi:hypothetical protein EDD29_8313 [Actinocorallia herbida]|uniref:Uncharacterized protein n=1 Tax=Actinocorallia herbida TaxID=58109 RepID=A0A3N1DAM0_9ACTN|nr:hypothetical protein [Actinocorallia herbida]ROO90582.1 hypothetical protein EDD29_8313 [Actinocorallia herbida]